MLFSKQAQHLPLRLCGVVVVVCLTFMLSACTSLFFYPSKTLVLTPEQLGYDYDEVWLETSDNIRLHAWLVKPVSQHKGTVFFLHGNAENISTHIRSVFWLVDAGYQVLALDYRGFGLSHGEPDVPEVFLDIDAGTRWLQEASSTKNKPMYLLGQSLGASLALTYLGNSSETRPQFNGLIVEAGFGSYGAIARHVASGHWLTWAFQYPAQWILTNRFDPVNVIESLSPMPLLVIHSTEDEVVPFQHGQQLYELAAQPKTFVTARGAHIQAGAYPDVQAAVLGFMSDNSATVVWH